MNKGTIYICGPMRGCVDHNFPNFRAATARFREAGWTVHCPVEIGERAFQNDPDVPGGDYLRNDIRAIAECDSIALLSGWAASTGARCEVALAITMGLKFYCAHSMNLTDPPERVIVAGGYERPAGNVDTLDDLRLESIAWANSTFTSANRASKAEHLRREANELCANPNDAEEMADIFLLLAHISDGVDLHSAVRAKLEKNKARKWGKPDAHGVVEHVAEGDLV